MTPDEYVKWFQGLSCCEKAAVTEAPCPCMDRIDDWVIGPADEPERLKLKPASNADVVRALHDEGLTNVEIAKRLNTTNWSVKQALRRARREGILPVG